LQVFCVAVQAPATQVKPFPHSAGAVHGHGPALPPHAWHLPAVQVALPVQSVFVVHSFSVPGAVPGAEQSPLWQASPRGHWLLFVHLVVQPLAVQTDPGLQLALPVHVARGGAVIAEQP
jgi:hypothetical protein